MKAHHTQTHAPLRGHASSLLRADAPGGGRCRIGSSPPGHRVGEDGRPRFGLSGVSLSLSVFLFLFFIFRGPLLRLWEEEGGVRRVICYFLGKVFGTNTCRLATEQLHRNTHTPEDLLL